MIERTKKSQGSRKKQPHTSASVARDYASAYTEYAARQGGFSVRCKARKLCSKTSTRVTSCFRELKIRTFFSISGTLRTQNAQNAQNAQHTAYIKSLIYKKYKESSIIESL